MVQLYKKYLPNEKNLKLDRLFYYNWLFVDSDKENHYLLKNCACQNN